MKDKMAKLKWDEFYALPIDDKCKYFTHDGMIYDILYAQQFDRYYLDKLFVLTNKIRLIHKTTVGAQWLKGLLPNKKAILYFVQPSTRTYLSFATACQTLGIEVSDVRSVDTSSELKGESFEDTIRTVSSYFDLIIMRHPEQGYSERASFELSKTRRHIPTINAGSGKDQHPTQALLDIFTLRRSFSTIGGLKNKTIMMVGDLKRGRTVRSLSYLLSNFENVRLIFSSPKAFAMEEDMKSELSERGIDFIETTDFHKYIPEVDAIYMTRIQDEHDVNNESKSFDLKKYSFGQENLSSLKPNAILMHPLPRRQEISDAVDSDPRAMYWRQVRNGMWTRVALMARIFGLEEKILLY